MVTVRYLNNEKPTIYDAAHWAVTHKDGFVVAVRRDGDEAYSEYIPRERIAKVTCDEGERLFPLERDDPEFSEHQLAIDWGPGDAAPIVSSPDDDHMPDTAHCIKLVSA